MKYRSGHVSQKCLDIQLQYYEQIQYFSMKDVRRNKVEHHSITNLSGKYRDKARTLRSHGWHCPSVKTIARETGYSERQVIKARKILEEQGKLKTIKIRYSTWTKVVKPRMIVAKIKKRSPYSHSLTENDKRTLNREVTIEAGSGLLNEAPPRTDIRDYEQAGRPLHIPHYLKSSQPTGEANENLQPVRVGGGYTQQFDPSQAIGIHGKVGCDVYF